MSQDQLFAAFQAFMQAQGIGSPEVGVIVESDGSETHVPADPRKPIKRVAKRTTAKRTTAKRTTTTPAKKRASAKPRTCNITAGEAWNALGADPEFEPKDHSKPASGPMLWRLNERGELAQFFA